MRPCSSIDGIGGREPVVVLFAFGRLASFENSAIYTRAGKIPSNALKAFVCILHPLLSGSEQMHVPPFAS